MERPKEERIEATRGSELLIIPSMVRVGGQMPAEKDEEPRRERKGRTSGKSV